MQSNSLPEAMQAFETAGTHSIKGEMDVGADLSVCPEVGGRSEE